MTDSDNTDVVDAFHRLYYDNFDRTWNNTYWMGVPTQKCPLDLWIYQEILFELRPNVIIETGTCKGGSALYLAAICDLIKVGRIITVDIDCSHSPQAQTSPISSRVVSRPHDR